mmetsp:Transcript_22512/g.41443  ORF Transcript_22512/g.41443 Transcript_22512/m.41443 type:complete len:335 (+) Transcript_22512:176-1180(+)
MAAHATTVTIAEGFKDEAGFNDDGGEEMKNLLPGTTAKVGSGENLKEAAVVFDQRPLNLPGTILAIFPGAILVVVRLVSTLVLFPIFVVLIVLTGSLGCEGCSVWLMRFGCRLWLFFLGFIWITYSGTPYEIPEEGAVLVGNHTGGVDILWMVYYYGPAFIANADVADLPLVGICAKQLQCIFVDRTTESAGTSKAIAAFFDEKRGTAPRLCIFPEGTSTNGQGVVTFRTGAFLSPVTVLPHAFELPFHEGCQYDPYFSIAYHMPYLCGLMSQIYNCMQVEFLPPDRYDASVPVKERAERVRKQISDSLEVPLYDLRWKDKQDLETSMGIEAGH